MKTKLLITAGILIVLFLFFKPETGKLFASGGGAEKEKKEKKKDESPSSGVKIIRQWDMPEELNEISGIAWMSEGRFACVQDEEGTVFIYNINNEKIEDRISFAGAGDYEEITLNGNTAYVVRADGMIYEISDITKSKPKVTTYKTPFTVDHNIEALSYDGANNRLLMAVKDDDLFNETLKGIYAFDLATKKVIEKPVYSIDVSDSQLKGRKKAIRPSAMALHPQTRIPYLIDGPGSRLMILDKNGKLDRVISLGNSFAQPEGLSFDPEGNIFISNERGKKSAGNIIKIKIE